MLGRGDVTELGAVLAGNARGRQSPQENHDLRQHGLAIQDLGVALVAMEQATALDLPQLDL